METSFYDRYARLEDTHWWFMGRRTVVSRAVELAGPWSCTSSRILEIGCGTGGMLPLLGAFGRPYGLDVSHAVLGAATQRASTRLVCGDSASLPFGDASFDAVCAFDVLEHSADDRGTLDELHRVCRPGGRLIVSVPAFSFLWGRQDVVSHHYRRYNRPQLLTLLDGAGFRTRYSSYFNTWLFPAVAAIRLARRLVPDDSTDVGRSDFDQKLPGPINTLLARLFASEAVLIGRMRLPVGVSLLATAIRH